MSTILEDFKEFFGKTREEMLAEFKIDYPDIRRKLFYEIMPNNDAEARSMYTSMRYAIHYLNNISDDFFDRIEEETKVGYYRVNHTLVAAGCVDNKPLGASVLDYGAGHAQYGLWLHFLGYKLTISDIPHDFFKFLQFICEKRNMGIKFAPIVGEVAVLPEKYDYIICSEMLEHCWNPLTVLQHLVNHMKEYGLIYISDFYNDCQGADPSHLKHNNVLQDVDFKMQQYKNTGIEPYISDVNGVLKIWKRYE